MYVSVYNWHLCHDSGKAGLDPNADNAGRVVEFYFKLMAYRQVGRRDQDQDQVQVLA